MNDRTDHPRGSGPNLPKVDFAREVAHVNTLSAFPTGQPLRDGW